MSSVAQKLGKIAISAITCLVVFDIVGVVLCAFFDFDPVSGSGTALSYLIWFVMGGLCGLFSYNAGGSVASPKSQEDWTSRDDAGKTGLLVVLIMSIVLVTLSIGCYRLIWRYGMDSNSFAPDSAPRTLTFFVTAFAFAVLAHTALLPKLKKNV
jgi:hypothetical protein